MTIDESVSSLLKSPHEQDRKKAIGILCRKSDRDAVIALQQIAEVDESIEVRFYARKALAAAKGMRRPKTDDALLMLVPDVLDTDTFLRFDDEEKCALIQTLIAQNRSDSLPCFLSLLPIEQNPQMIAAMVMAVGAFGTSTESKVLIPYLGHKDARVRANTIEALELLGNLKLFAYIFPLLEDTDNRVRANAARSLKSIEPFTSFRLLQAMISSGKLPFQSSAIYVLRYFVSDASTALVAPFLESPHKELRLRSEQTLRVLAGKGIARALELTVGLPQVAEPVSPESVIEDIENHSGTPEERIESLKQAFKIADPRKRLETIEMESIHLGGKSVEHLIGYLDYESDPLVVGKIYILLGRLYDSRALPVLLKGLRHQDDRCRANAVEAIGMISEPASLKHLVAFLKDPHNRVRGNAILALRSVSDVDIAQPLKQLTESSEELYQRTAIYVLAELQRVEFFPLLQQLLRSSFATVRKNTLTAIGALEKAGYHFPKIQPEVEPEVHIQNAKEVAVADSGVNAQPANLAAHQAIAEQVVNEQNVILAKVDLPTIPELPAKQAVAQVSGHESTSSFFSLRNVIGMVAIVLILAIIAGTRVAIDVSSDRAAKAVMIEAAQAHAQEAHERGLEVLAGISLLANQAAEAQTVVEQQSSAVLSAQKNLDRISAAVDKAVELSAVAITTYLKLHNAGKIVGGHCQSLSRLIEELKKNLPGKQNPYTGIVSPENTKAELSALARIKQDLQQAAVSIGKLPENLVRAQKSLPEPTVLEHEYARFAKLRDALPEADRMLAALDERIASVAKESARTAETGIALSRASAEHRLVTQLSDLHRSLGSGQERLTRCRESLASSTISARNFEPTQSSAELLASLNKAAVEIATATRLLVEIPEVPAMLEKAQAKIVRVLAILHQKVFAETVRMGIASEISANWDSVVSGEAKKIVALYANAHTLNDTVTTEKVLQFAEIEPVTLEEELKAAAASAAVASVYLGNASALFGDASGAPVLPKQPAEKGPSENAE